MLSSSAAETTNRIFATTTSEEKRIRLILGGKLKLVVSVSSGKLVVPTHHGISHMDLRGSLSAIAAQLVSFQPKTPLKE